MSVPQFRSWWRGRVNLVLVVLAGGGVVPGAAVLAQDKPGADAPSRMSPSAQPAGASGPAPARGAAQPPAPAPGEEDITLGGFAEAVDLRALVAWVAETLNINVAATDVLSGSVVINAPITVKRQDLLGLLGALLEQQGFALFFDPPSGWYRVVRAEDVPAAMDGELTTTRVIVTPAVRPSSLQGVIDAQLGVQGRTLRVSYLDELGVVVLTDTPRRVALAEELIARVLARAGELAFIRFDLEHVAASVARQRVVDLLGQVATGILPGVPAQAVVPPGGFTPSLAGLGDRLSVDARGNALILRGYPDEAEYLRRVLSVVDRPSGLEYRQHYGGPAARQIAELAQRLGLGTVEVIESVPASQPTAAAPGVPVPRAPQIPGMPEQATRPPAAGGPVMVVDESRGVILYSATPSQHSELAALIRSFEIEREQVVIVPYKLRNLPADDVAEVITALITGQAPTGGSAFLPGAGARQPRGRAGGTLGRQRGMEGGGEMFGQTLERQPAPRGVGVTGAGTSPFGPGDVFVIADRANNQILVRASQRQQPEFARLIARLDQRRPQVYIEVQIVSVTASDDFRLAFETQLINARGTGGVVNTSFGLGTFPAPSAGAPGDILARKTVATGLSGITAAVIKSDQVPIILHALKRQTDTRILSSPQLLVDDNETAEIVSLELQPTTTVSQGQATTLTSFGGYEEAGTRLLVTPSISEAGYMRLAYVVELSNFVGTSADPAIPPPKQERSVTSDSVTIPGDMTIVVGGIRVDSRSHTVLKVPLLGDIPLVGLLFRDTRRDTTDTRLYVFITPRILRDPDFRDLMLLTRGPQAEALLAEDLPELVPAMVDMVEPPPARINP